MIKKSMKQLLTFVFCLLPITMFAQQSLKSFTLDDLMWGGSNYWNLQPRGFYSTFWGNRLVALDVEEVQLLTNKKGKALKHAKPLFTLSDLKEGTGMALTGLSLYHVVFPSADEPLVLLTLSKERILYNWEKKNIVWRQQRTVGTTYSEYCPASRSEAFIKDFNLYLTTADGKTHQISTDANRELLYGASVHRDEFGYHKGTFFSPSGKLLAFTRMDQTMVKDYPQVNIFTREAVCAPDKYPMAGMTMHKVTIGVYNPQTEKTVYMQAGDPTNRYFTNPSWSPDEQTLYLIEVPRSQDKAELVAYDASTGQRKGVLYTETNAKYVHPVNGITFLPWDSNHFIYQSERDGYNHLYIFSADGKEQRQLTKGAWVVEEIAGFDIKNKRVIIKSTEASPISGNYYAVDVASGKRTPLDNEKGVHRATFSADGSQMVDRWESPRVFRSYELTDTHKGKSVNLQTDTTPWKNFNVPEITSGTLKAADGKTDLYYRLVKPINFDAKKKYPTVVYVYGGPGVRNVEAGWNYDARPWEIYMAQKGYVVFILDNRGSNRRGFEFESATFRHLGDVEMEDQMCGVDYLRSLPYVDTDRMGVHGWSFGGFMTTNLMLTHPDVFKVGVAGGPVIDWKYYEVMYGERYMDTPQENPEGYKSSSLLNKAGNLKGRLQIIIGYNDPVCVPQHSLSFLRACEDAGTQPDFFCYPGQGHNMRGKDMVHLHERITRYFEDFLK